MDLGIYLERRGAGMELAARIGVTNVMVSQWRKGIKPVPVDRCPLIEAATGGVVTVEDLRPDAAWVRVADAGWPHSAGRPLLDIAGQQKEAA